MKLRFDLLSLVENVVPIKFSIVLPKMFQMISYNDDIVNKTELSQKQILFSSIDCH